jgi:hypothetical protein
MCAAALRAAQGTTYRATRTRAAVSASSHHLERVHQRVSVALFTTYSRRKRTKATEFGSLHSDTNQWNASAHTTTLPAKNSNHIMLYCGHLASLGANSGIWHVLKPILASDISWSRAPGQLSHPAGHHAEGHHHQVGTRHAQPPFERGQERDALQRLAQAHLVSQDGVEPALVLRQQPRNALNLRRGCRWISGSQQI